MFWNGFLTSAHLIGGFCYNKQRILENEKIFLSFIGVSLLISCTHLTYKEQENLRILKNNGITIDKAGYYEAPNSALAAGLLNILPGFGNFYLAMREGADSNHYVFGFINLLLWPFSPLWAIPEGVIDAQTINKREMIYYYKSDPYGKHELRQKGIILE